MKFNFLMELFHSVKTVFRDFWTLWEFGDTTMFTHVCIRKCVCFRYFHLIFSSVRWDIERLGETNLVCSFNVKLLQLLLGAQWKTCLKDAERDESLRKGILYPSRRNEGVSCGKLRLCLIRFCVHTVLRSQSGQTIYVASRNSHNPPASSPNFQFYRLCGITVNTDYIMRWWSINACLYW